MSDLFKAFKHAGLTVKLHFDMDATSPREDSDTGLFLVANHPDFYVPGPGQTRVPSDYGELVERYRKTHWIFRLEAYIHSGVVLALSGEGNFPDRRWDVSQLGAVFVAKAEWRLSAKARKAAESYIETWNQYLSGDVYGYVIEDEDGNDLDSCWGFYGDDYAEQQAKAAAESASKHRAAEACLI